MAVPNQQPWPTKCPPMEYESIALDSKKSKAVLNTAILILRAMGGPIPKSEGRNPKEFRNPKPCAKTQQIENLRSSPPRVASRLFASVPLFPLQGMLETYHTADQAVVMGMRSRSEPFLDSFVKPMLARRHAGFSGDLNPKSPQPRRRDEHQQRFLSYFSLSKIGQAFPNQLCARKLASAFGTGHVATRSFKKLSTFFLNC
jgi:hypothetical protein